MVLVVIRPSGTITVGAPHVVPSACAGEGPSIKTRAVTKTAPAAFLSISFSLAGQRTIVLSWGESRIGYTRPPRDLSRPYVIWCLRSQGRQRRAAARRRLTGRRPERSLGEGS